MLILQILNDVNGIQMEILRLIPMGRNADRDAKWGIFWERRLRLQSMISIHTKPTYHLNQGPKIDPSLRACSGHDGRVAKTFYL